MFRICKDEGAINMAKERGPRGPILHQLRRLLSVRKYTDSNDSVRCCLQEKIHSKWSYTCRENCPYRVNYMYCLAQDDNLYRVLR